MTGNVQLYLTGQARILRRMGGQIERERDAVKARRTRPTAHAARVFPVSFGERYPTGRLNDPSATRCAINEIKMDGQLNICEC